MTGFYQERRASVAARHPLETCVGLLMHESGIRMGICMEKGNAEMRNSRWPVWFHHSCCRCRCRSRPSAASIVKRWKGEAQQGGWCRRRRQAIWSVEGRSEGDLVRRLASVVANSVWNSFRLLLPQMSRRALARAMALFSGSLFHCLSVPDPITPRAWNSSSRVGRF